MGFLKSISNVLGKAADTTYTFASDTLAISHWLSHNPEARQTFESLGTEPDFWCLPDAYNQTSFGGAAVVVDGKYCYTVGEAKATRDASNEAHGRNL